MSNVIERKESLLARRDALLVVLAVICVSLLTVSLSASVQRESDFAKERMAALEADRTVWLGQGARNPHSAAHFSRYAFRASAPLSVIDPGVSDYAGVAVWLEAHFQDPAEFRRAEDIGDLGRHVQISPAFIFLVALPLLVFVALYGSIAAEREDGTLRLLVASGVSDRDFFIGKFVAGLRMTLPLYVVVFALVCMWMLLVSPAVAGWDTYLRLGLAFVLYAIYLVSCVAIAIAVSSLFATRRGALLGLLCVWAVMSLMVPRFSMEVSTHVYPQPDAREMARQLRAASDIYYADKDEQARIRQSVLEEYGVTSVDQLPIDYGAYVLQVSEQMSEPEFERVYGSITQRHQAQNTLARWFTMLSPLIPAASLSRGFAGTDGVHQNHFVTAAESHRRQMIKMLNEDFMYNAGPAGYSYAADETLWQRFNDFTHPPLLLRQIWPAYFWDGLLLLLWLCVAIVSSFLLTRRAFKLGVA